MSKKALQTFNVTAKMTITASIEIRAENLEDAALKAKELEADDFIEVVSGGEWIDCYGFTIEGAYK
jgi:hypothetical protein